MTVENRKNLFLSITTFFAFTLLFGCQRQPVPSASPSPAPSIAAPSPTPFVEPALLDDGLDDALKELEVVE